MKFLNQISVLFVIFLVDDCINVNIKFENFDSVISKNSTSNPLFSTGTEILPLSYNQFFNVRPVAIKKKRRKRILKRKRRIKEGFNTHLKKDKKNKLPGDFNAFKNRSKKKRELTNKRIIQNPQLVRSSYSFYEGELRNPIEQEFFHEQNFIEVYPEIKNHKENHKSNLHSRQLEKLDFLPFEADNLEIDHINRKIIPDLSTTPLIPKNYWQNYHKNSLESGRKQSVSHQFFQLGDFDSLTFNGFPKVTSLNHDLTINDNILNEGEWLENIFVLSYVCKNHLQ